MARGGKRKGAGRPRKGAEKLVPVEVYVSPAVRDAFDKIAVERASTRSEQMRIELTRAAQRAPAQ